MKEYIELVESIDGFIVIHEDFDIKKSNFQWHKDKISMLNRYAKEGWTVVGYRESWILLERTTK